MAFTTSVVLGDNQCDNTSMQMDNNSNKVKDDVGIHFWSWWFARLCSCYVSAGATNTPIPTPHTHPKFLTDFENFSLVQSKAFHMNATTMLIFLIYFGYLHSTINITFHLNVRKLLIQFIFLNKISWAMISESSYWLLLFSPSVSYVAQLLTKVFDSFR